MAIIMMMMVAMVFVVVMMLPVMIALNGGTGYSPCRQGTDTDGGGSSGRYRRIAIGIRRTGTQGKDYTSQRKEPDVFESRFDHVHIPVNVTDMIFCLTDVQKISFSLSS